MIEIFVHPTSEDLIVRYSDGKLWAVNGTYKTTERVPAVPPWWIEYEPKDSK